MNPDPMVPILYPVQRVMRETSDTFTWTIGPMARSHFMPGQFNMLYMYGVGEVPISICGDPARRDVLVHTIRNVGGVTRAMEDLRRGTRIGVRGPFGRGWPMAEAEGQNVLVIAGGLGMAPLRPVIYYVLRHREKYRRLILLYGARTPADLLYRRELQRWATRLDVALTVDRGDATWNGNVGVVPALIARCGLEPATTIAMVCGPELMMRFTVRELEKRGLPDDRIYVSMERNMQCGVGLCGHCQYGPGFACKDGPVYRYDAVEPLFCVREI